MARTLLEPTMPRSDVGSRLPAWIEAIGVFALGFVVMNFLYAWSVGRAGDEIGVPEHDSYYHVAMAEMLPEHGLVGKFPWLQYTYFRKTGDDFVSHHWGFHLLLLPFVKAAQWTTGNALDGGRWAMCAVFGANLMLFHLLLRTGRVPWHWLWVALFLLLPDQFLARHGYVRAIGASFLFMQLLLLCLFHQRWLLAGVTLAGYVHLYLGAVMYGPVIVAAYAIALAVGAKGERIFPWKMVLITAAGWLIGVVTYPYAAGMYEFLKMQVFGSGLSPDIAVGREWKPYSDAWFIVTMSGTVLAVWVAAILLRLRLGPRLDAREAALVALQFGFLLLMFKARRFVEYWPPICLLSAAYIIAPPLRVMSQAVAEWFAARQRASQMALRGLALSGMVCAALAAIAYVGARSASSPMLAEWRVFALLIAILLLPALVRIWSGAADATGSARQMQSCVGVAACGAAFGGVAIAAMWLLSRGSALESARMHIPGWAIGIIIALYGIAPVLIATRRIVPVSTAVGGRLSRSLAVLCVALLLPATVIGVGTRSLSSASRQVRCYYNLDDMRQLMAFLKQASQPGDIVFTDDWDTFPVFFYHNRVNHYIVGLDPKFTHARDPELWERYVKLSRGEAPTTIRLTSDGGVKTRNVKLTDIRDHFRARFIVCDLDHRRLADDLAAEPEFAEFVFPGSSYAAAKAAPFVVFRVRQSGDESDAAGASAGGGVRSDLSLASLTPESVEQGWGDLASDRSVDGNVMRMQGKRYTRGVGTHVPSRIVFAIPDGFGQFEAIVGIDDETGGRGSATVSVLLDGKRAFESDILTGGGEPAVVRVQLGGARQITLVAEPTEDGQRFDHVNWADARFLVTDAESSAAQHARRDTADARRR